MRWSSAGRWTSCRRSEAVCVRRRRFLSYLCGLPACRVPARRPGNFHLRPQMKVTKAKGLSAKPLSSFFAPCLPGPAGGLETPPGSESPARWARPRFASALGSSVFSRARLCEDPRRRARCGADMPHCVQWPAGRGSAACRTHKWCCVEGLCFGDFHLALQMKVTRPPGRDPASWHAAMTR